MISYKGVSNQVGLWYNLQLDLIMITTIIIKVSNQVGLWYNLQLGKIAILKKKFIKFQTKLDCGIICNENSLNLLSLMLLFQTKLDCGIICNFLLSVL